MKTIIRNGRKIIGFVGENSDGFYFAFGKPSQPECIAFRSETKEQAIIKVHEHCGVKIPRFTLISNKWVPVDELHPNPNN